MLSNEDSEIAEWFNKEFSKKYDIHINLSVKKVEQQGEILTIEMQDH